MNTYFLYAVLLKFFRVIVLSMVGTSKYNIFVTEECIFKKWAKLGKKKWEKNLEPNVYQLGSYLPELKGPNTSKNEGTNPGT